MSEEIVNTVEFQYKFQLRGAILCVAFQVFALAFLYLMSWNYELIKTSLTPIFWAVLFSISLHGPKTSMVQYLCQYDKRLKNTIEAKIDYFKKYNSFFWWIPTFFITILYRILYFWQPIFFDVQHQARRYSKTIMPMPPHILINNDNKSAPKSKAISRVNKPQESSSLTSFTFNATSEDADDDDSEQSELSSDGIIQFDNANKSKFNTVRHSISMEAVIDGGEKVYSLSKWLLSPMGLFCTLFVVLCSILLKSDVVDQLGLYTIFSNVFLLLVIASIIAAIFVFIPAWSKATYNTFVVIFLILTLIGISTLISGVLLFKIADETNRFVALAHEVVDNSQVFKNLHMDSYINATSAKLLESLQMHLGPEMDEETFKKILANDHINWTDTFANFFSGGDSGTNTSMQTTVNYINSQNNTEITTEQEVDGGLMTELSKLASGDFDVIKFCKKLAKSIFGEHEWVKAVINLDFQKYIEKAQEWGLDLPFINKILLYMQQFTTIISANLLGIISLLLSFSSWIISLGLNFMVFLACLFYLLVESDAVFATLGQITSVVPADLNEIDAHFLHSLFKSIQDIFVVTFEIFVCHAFVTWFTFYIFDIDFSFATAFSSGVFSIIPYFPPWIVCMHGVIYLIYQHQVINSLIMLSMHFALLWIDPILMERIENSHPYLTATSIVLGLTQFGLNGAIIGPLLVCLTSWSLKVIAFYCKHFATFEMDKKRHENYLIAHKSKGYVHDIQIEDGLFKSNGQ